MSRLVRQHLATGEIHKALPSADTGFTRTYTAADVALLAETDALATTRFRDRDQALDVRALLVFGDTHYARLASISVAHLYNLRAAAGYRARRHSWSKTRPTRIAIGEPDGCPGYLRIDSVHQGDEDGVKGVYHINAVDCVTPRYTAGRISLAPCDGGLMLGLGRGHSGGSHRVEVDRKSRPSQDVPIPSMLT